MKKRFFPAATATLAIMMVAVAFWSGPNPAVHAEPSSAEWRLTVTGLVEHPLNLSLAELMAMPQTTVNAELICVGSPSGVVAEGNWVGVRLWSLLEAAGASPEAVKVAFHATDGYSTDLGLEAAQREDIIVAYAKDGVSLSETLRLVVPGKWGYKWISDLSNIELVDYDFLGYWEAFGYPDDADIDGDVPEFSTFLAMLAPLIMVTFVLLALKKRVKKPVLQQPVR